jgi:hypothetical protein
LKMRDPMWAELMPLTSKNAQRDKPGTNLNAWLFTILRNAFHCQFRKARRQVGDADGSYAARLRAPPEQHGKCDVQDMLRALTKVPVDQREALLLIVAEGLSYEDAAQTVRATRSQRCRRPWPGSGDPSSASGYIVRVSTQRWSVYSSCVQVVTPRSRWGLHPLFCVRTNNQRSSFLPEPLEHDRQAPFGPICNQGCAGPFGAERLGAAHDARHDGEEGQ